jgi:hypothetical protein
MTIVRVTSGGIPVTESATGYPYYEADNGFGITTGGNGINFSATSTTMTNLIAQNVTATGFPNNGIVFQVSSTGRLANPQILNCSASDNAFSSNNFTAGINVGGNGNSATSYWPITNLLVSGCVSHDNAGNAAATNWSGTGIKVGSCASSLVTGCTAYHNGTSTNNVAGGPTGIWMSVCNTTFIKFCESYLNKSPALVDGCGFDMDGGTQNSGCLYNYSHDNDGAGFMDFSFSGASGDNLNNVIAFNISVNDGVTNSSAIRIVGSGNNLTGSQVYNNTVFRKSSVASTGCVQVSKGTGSFSATIANNIFVSQNANCKLLFTNATNPGAGVVLAGNCYYATSTFSIEWNGTSYSTYAAWQTATGQEKIAGTNVGFNVNPKTYSIGDNTTANPFGNHLTTTSPLLNTGVNLFSNFGIDPGARDYFGGTASTSGPYSVGCSWAGSAVASFTPAALSPVLWVEAGKGGIFQSRAGTTSAVANNDVVGFLPDLSGNGKNQLSVADDTTRPTLQGVGVQPYVSFDGVNDMLTSAAINSYAAGSASWFFAMNSASAVNFAVLAGEASTTSANPFYVLAQRWNSGNQSTAGISNDANTSLASSVGATGTFDGTDHVFGIVDTGTSLIPYLDGVAGTAHPYTRSGTVTVDNFSLGAFHKAAISLWCVGRIYSGACVNRALTSLEIANLTTYLGATQGRSL